MDVSLHEQQVRQTLWQGLAWMCEQRDWSLDTLLDVVETQLRGTTKSESSMMSLEWLALYLKLFDSDYLRAESTLVRLLSHLHHSSVRGKHWKSEVRGRVDWASTIIAHPGQPLHKYCHIAEFSRPDNKLNGGLRCLAMQWCRRLRGVIPHSPNARIRLQSLQRAYQTSDVAIAPMDDWCWRRLHNIAPKEAALIHRVHARFNNQHKGVALKRQLENLAKPRYIPSRAKRPEYVLETVQHLLCAQAASVNGWQLESVNWRERDSHHHILLSKHIGDSDQLWNCRIYKGTLVSRSGQALLKTDKLTDLFHINGLSSSGVQPDLVVDFWQQDNPQHTVFIGDAKFNSRGSHDGLEYIKSSIRKMLAYRYALTNSVGEHHRVLDPIFLLFIQGISKPKLPNRYDEYPAVWCLDINSASCSSEGIENNPVTSWFCHIATHCIYND